MRLPPVRGELTPYSVRIQLLVSEPEKLTNTLAILSEILKSQSRSIFPM